MNLHDIIRRPLITEKATDLQEQDKYVFEVARSANKLQVKGAVEKVFNVHVVDVNVVTVPGKLKRRGRRQVPTSAWKKAIVQLRPGDRITYFEGV
ncbi:MAG: 50S ribosomal protein L23 [Dehalococcoidia bacterium]|jgi:large subunit ribosomal protein L23|nr:50S ribosomal protein L23 [Dehalococcoidia bacterium]